MIGFALPRRSSRDSHSSAPDFMSIARKRLSSVDAMNATPPAVTIDMTSGAELWESRLERRGNANPITYQGSNGKQYVAVAATDTLVVYALP